MTDPAHIDTEETATATRRLQWFDWFSIIYCSAVVILIIVVYSVDDEPGAAGELIFEVLLLLLFFPIAVFAIARSISSRLLRFVPGSKVLTDAMVAVDQKVRVPWYDIASILGFVLGASALVVLLYGAEIGLSEELAGSIFNYIGIAFAFFFPYS